MMKENTKLLASHNVFPEVCAISCCTSPSHLIDSNPFMPPHQCVRGGADNNKPTTRPPSTSKALPNLLPCPSLKAISQR